MQLFRKRFLITISLLVFTTLLFAQDDKLCGAVDYSWGAEGLDDAMEYVGTLLGYTVLICFAISGVVTVISALQIYIKIQTGEEGIKKELIMLFGGFIFIFFSSLIMPAFFGFEL